MTWRVGEVTFSGTAQRRGLPAASISPAPGRAPGRARNGCTWIWARRARLTASALNWIRRPAEGAIQVSSDDTLTGRRAASNVDEMKLASLRTRRYVRALMTKPATADGYMLSEMEVYGEGGPVVVPGQHPAAGRPAGPGGRRLARSARFAGEGQWRRLSKAGFKDDDWVVATVPGTVLASYYNAGAVPDPNFGDNQTDDFGFVLLCGFLVSQRVHGSSAAAAGRHVLAELRWHQLEGGRLPQRRKARAHRRRFHARTLRRHRAAAARPEECARRAQSRRTRRPAASNRRPSKTPTRTAALWARTTPPITPPSAGTGSPPSAAAIPASGTVCS